MKRIPAPKKTPVPKKTKKVKPPTRTTIIENPPIRTTNNFNPPTRNRQSSSSSVYSVTDPELKYKTSDDTFEVTAKLIVNYLLPKVHPDGTAYHLDSTDLTFLDAVVPEDVREPFVSAVAYRASLLSSGHESPLESLVNDCTRLGLGRDDCFLLGGGHEMEDGRILVLIDNNFAKKMTKGPQGGNNVAKKNGMGNGRSVPMNTAQKKPSQQKVLPPSAKRPSTPTSRRSRTPSRARSRTPTGRRSRTPTRTRSQTPTGRRPMTPTAKSGRENLDVIMPVVSNLSMVNNKEVIGGGGRPPIVPNDSMRSQRSIQRRMRSFERKQQMLLHEETEPALLSNWSDSLWDYQRHGIFHKFLLLTYVAPLRELYLFCFVFP